MRPGLAPPLGPTQRRNRAIAMFTRSQHGLLTRAQATGMGLSKSAIARRLATGALERVMPGVFAASEALLGLGSVSTSRGPFPRATFT